jgi:hypothetical protein
MESKIVCRKCNGPHLTIKCGKEKENKIEKLIVNENKEGEHVNVREDKPTFFKKEYSNRGNENYRNNRNNEYTKENETFKKRKYHKVKINYLPVDMTEEELLEALYEDCGLKVSKIKVNNYDESSNAYIEFRTEEEVKYIIDSLHKTAFEHAIIHVEQIVD